MGSPARILVIDDEPSICWGIERLGRREGYEVQTAASAEQALEGLDRAAPDVVLLDVRLPGMDGLTAIDAIRAQLPHVPIVVMTAYGDLQTAVDAVERNVFEYLIKPFDLQMVREIIDRALKSHESDPPVETESLRISGFVGTSAAMQEVYKSIALAAASDANVLVTGESGTGKELTAHAIHEHSRRADRPFVPVNLASLPVTLAESELFGHVRGAFTGADRDREGLLVQANGGTLFLDEIADIPRSIQVKLLRVFEEGRVTPVGGRQSVATRFRVIAATHQDLWRAVESGAFRHDLYFRLAAYQIHLPPLRERADDVRLLAEHFLERLGRSLAHLDPSTLSELESRPWYGNVRELRNAIEHATVVARQGRIMPFHLPPAIDRPIGQSQVDDLDAMLKQAVVRWAEASLERDRAPGRLHEEWLALAEPPLLEAVLDRLGHNYRAAADRLGIHRTTLKRKIEAAGLASENQGDE